MVAKIEILKVSLVTSKVIVFIHSRYRDANMLIHTNHTDENLSAFVELVCYSYIGIAILNSHFSKSLCNFIRCAFSFLFIFIPAQSIPNFRAAGESRNNDLFFQAGIFAKIVRD